MKKYLKLQAKKSLSLLMAVLMLMSCWVWVAPTEAEAAGSEDGQYYVKITAYLDTYCNNTDADTLTLYYKEDNGTGAEKSFVAHQDTSVYKKDNNGTTLTLYSGYVSGFPTKITHYLSLNGSSRTLRLTNVQLFVGKDANNCNVQVLTGDASYRSYDASTNWTGKESDCNVTINVDAANNPVYQADADATLIEKTIPEIGDTTVFTDSYRSHSLYDQYGVRFLIIPTYYLADSEGDQYNTKNDQNEGLWLTSSGTENTTSYKVATNLSSALQVKNLGLGSKQKTFYLCARFYNANLNNGDAKIVNLVKYVLNYPEYTVKVDQNGSISDFSAPVKLSDGETSTDVWSFKGVYGDKADKYPVGGRDEETGAFLGSSMTGYTFKGFWTAPQPASGDASYNAEEAVFANPVSDTDFETYSKRDGSVVSGDFVTLADGSKYYKAGKEWNSETDAEVLGDATYYGWWVSKDNSVKFYDIDGKYLGSKIFKYGTKPGKTEYPDPKDSYDAGVFDYQGFTEKWMDITGVVVQEGEFKFGVDGGGLDTFTLTPVYEKKNYDDKYEVTFIQPDGTSGSQEYEYRHILDKENGEIPATVVTPPVLKNDQAYSYVFKGWSSQKPASGNYHIVASDDTTFEAEADWVVRNDITYYAVFESTVKSYVFAYKYTDSTGEEVTKTEVIPYGSAITTPGYVNRTYAKNGMGYNLDGWYYLNPDRATVTFSADGVLLFTKENVYITNSNLADGVDESPIYLEADYDDGTPMPYTVTFKYKDAKGNDSFIYADVNHGTEITQETVDRLVVPEKYDDGEALYTFANKWIVTEGTADKAEYTAAEFTSFSPVSHVTFEAVYGEGVPFHTVTYHANNMVYTERILQGLNVPAWMVSTGEKDEDGNDIMKEYVPMDIVSEIGTYKFAGWFDAPQADEDCAATNGTEYTTASTVEGDLNLYAQYIFEPFKFAIKFVSYDGKTVLAETEIEAGESFEAAYEEAMAKTDRAADKTYYYTFIGWDNPTGSFLCEGRDMTFTAQYKPSYIYYKARWYNDIDAMNGAHEPEMEMVGEDGLLAITNHTYEGKVYAPSVDLVIPEGKVFAGWYYKDGENEVLYQRGMTIRADMAFYAKYEDAPVVYTLNAVVGGETSEYKIAEGGTAEVVGTPLDGYVDETTHNKFAGWYTTADFTEGTDFSLDTVITADTTIYAKFEVTEHTKDQKELVTAPTYYVKGTENAWCACNKDETLVTNEIPMLTDTVAPTGTIYLGTQGKWSSTDEVFAKDDTKTYYANKDTDLILTINDTAGCADAGTEGHTCVNCTYNPAGTGIGIKMIRAFVSSDTFTAEEQGNAASLALTIFEDTTEELTNTANYTVNVEDFAGVDLENGKEYIIYYYAVDKANNVLNTNVRTAKFIYDDEAPVFTVEGDSNAATATTTTVTYCGKATITNVEVGATVTVNGEEVALTTTSAAGTGSYTINEAGNYIIKITDKAGNSTSKKIVVTDGHNEVTTSQEVTCDADGYEKVTCAVCGKILKEETITSVGHQYGEKETVAPTCTDKGYDIQICSVCGYELKDNEKPAVGHTHAKVEAWTETADSADLEYILDGENKITKEEDGKTLYKIYELVYEVVTPATCCVEGKKISNCTVCGLDTKTATIPVDTENGHLYGGVKTLKATCTQDGEKYQTCKYCFEKKTVEVLTALNHTDTGRYTKVTTAATCSAEGVETTYCKACDAAISTKAIEMTAHTLKLVTYDKAEDKTEEFPNGYMQYECTKCDYKGDKTAIAAKATYSVTFKGAGAEGADLVITKTEGESIDATAVADQTKEKDNEYEYSFLGWKGSDGKVVKLPVVVTKNETYTAEFKATRRVYTHQFVVEAADAAARATEYVEFANIIGGYNDKDKKPVAVPTKAGTAMMTYEFAGWRNSLDSTGELVDDFTMTGDATFIAVFREVPVKYSVIFYDEDKTTVIWNTEVNGGANVKYANTEKVVDGETETEKLITPVKASDADKHYEFAGWKYGTGTVAISAEFGPIAETTRVYATYTGTEHSFAVVEGADKTWAATCTKEGQTTEKCTVCDYVKVTTEPVIPHNYELQEDGSQKCSACGDVIAPEAKLISVTINESVTYGEATMPTVAELKSFDEIEENSEFTYTAPEKAKTAEYEFTFVGWADADGEIVTDKADLKVTLGTEDVTYTAVYTAAVRKYNVTYVDAENKAISGYAFKIEYNGVVPAAPADPEKAITVNDHFTFDGWTVAAGTAVTADILIRPIFIREAHDYKETAQSTGATCTEPGGTKLVCAGCGDEITSGDTPALGHKYVAIESVPAEIGKEGYVKYECQNANCPEKYITETIPALTAKKLTVIVLDDATVVTDVKVEIFKGSERVYASTTNSSGTVEFKNADGEYTILVAGGATKTVNVTEDMTVTIDISEDTSAEPEQPGTQNPSCSCSCHRAGFWGMVFRFFHKVISWFTGRINCCSCPDPEYY